MADDANKLMVGGFPVRMTDQAHGWRLTCGTVAEPMSFSMMPEDAEQLLRLTSANEISVVLERPNGADRTEFKRLHVVGEGPAVGPFSRTVKVADRRFFWKNNHIIGRYNMHRVSGQRRIVSPAGTPAGILQVEDDIAFVKVSLNNGVPWKAMEVLKDILTRVVGQEGQDWEIRATPKGEALVQDFEIDDPGNVAVAKALGLLVGLDCYQEPGGKIIICSKLPGAADAIITGLGPPLVVGQVINRMNLAQRRAADFSGLVTREVGVRFDFDESLASVQDEDPWIINIFQTTDATTTLADGTIAPAGTWQPRDSLLPIWSALASAAAATVVGNAQNPFAAFPMDTATINKLFICQMTDVWEGLGADGSGTNEVIGRYVRQIQQNYRQCYIINPAYSSAGLRFRACNPGIIDPETGAEQESPVYVDHAVKPTNLAISRNPALATRDMGYSRREGNSAGAGLADRPRSPFVVTVISEQLGIFRIDPRLDPGGFEASIIPSAITADSIPGGDYFKAIRHWNEAHLDSAHRMNVILSVTSGYPNDDRQCERYKVTPSEVEAKFGLKLGSCVAPPYEKRIGPGLATAKFPYDDTKREEVKKVLGIIPGDPALGDAVNAKDLKELALACAAAYYYGKQDHYQGSKTVPLRGDITPEGEINEVAHTFEPNGRMLTTVSCGLIDADLVDPLALLPASARRTLLRAINPQGA